MPKKKESTQKKKLIKKKIFVKKTSSVIKKTKSQKLTNSKTKLSTKNLTDFLQVENENQLKSLITKEFDKELVTKADNYIKSYSKIDDSIITVNDFLNYIENLDEDLFKLFKAYSSSSENDGAAGEEKEEEEKSTSVKSDDPVRMYLKEMGNVELLSREGEIAIAKRIEHGLDKMMNSILECPASVSYTHLTLPTMFEV